MTSLQMELHAERKKRLARFARMAATIRRNEERQREVKKPPPTETNPEDNPLSVAFSLDMIERGKLDVRAVQFFVAAKYGVSRSDMLSDRRTGKLVAPRQVATWLCYRIFPHSLSYLGIKFRRDHTTILHSIKKVKGRILGDSAYCLAIGRLEEELRPYAPPLPDDEQAA